MTCGRWRWLGLLALASCVPAAQPPRGMAPFAPRVHDGAGELVEVARAESDLETRPLLVIHPRTACSGSASTVFLDEDGDFVGAIPPGGAALLTLRHRTRSLTMISSVEISAAPSTWTTSLTVTVPPLPDGLVLESARWNTRDCGNGQYAEARRADKATLERLLSEQEIGWLTPDPAEGRAWLEEHRVRVAEILGARRGTTPDVVAKNAR